MLWFILVRSHDSPQYRIIGEGWNKWGDLGNRKHGHYDEYLPHWLSYTIRLFSQFNIVLDSVLQTSSCILISCFDILTGRSEVKRKKFRFTRDILQSNELRSWKNAGGAAKIKNQHSRGDYLVHNNKSDQQQQHLPTTRDHCSLCKIKPGRQTA